MGNVGRILLRLLLVPLGYVAAVAAGTLVILIGSWKVGALAATPDPDAHVFAVFGIIAAGAVLGIMLLSVMWLPSAIGILLSEAFAIRSSLYHAGNGAVAAFIGWQSFSPLDESQIPLNQPLAIFAAGLAAGFAYWAVAGFSAGFWKPVFRRDPPIETAR